MEIFCSKYSNIFVGHCNRFVRFVSRNDVAKCDFLEKFIGTDVDWKILLANCEN